ncbi:MAG: SIMPL domain-containing protein [Candidatus Falkowbacteria bacterium]|nr:SIMPL domain-containing protein [Candidatus Falkowbacteria bacterium]
MLENQNCCANWRSPKVILALIAMLLLAGIIIVSILRERIVNEPQWQINVAGEGKVTYDPDIANVDLGVDINKVAKPADALNQLNAKMNSVIVAITKAGIPKENIQTQNYNLMPQYDVIDNVSQVTGYNASQNVIVKINGIDKNASRPADVIAAAGQAGTNKINGITFEASNFNDLKQLARLKAILDARSKASNIGRALGVRLGKVVGWWENFITPDYAQSSYDGKGGIGGGGAVSTPYIPTGARELIVDVNVSYKIK